jgi:hypothetical protein
MWALLRAASSRQLARVHIEYILQVGFILNEARRRSEGSLLRDIRDPSLPGILWMQDDSSEGKIFFYESLVLSSELKEATTQNSKLNTENSHEG